jgi:hypothetical protein
MDNIPHDLENNSKITKSNPYTRISMKNYSKNILPSIVVNPPHQKRNTTLQNYFHESNNSTINKKNIINDQTTNNYYQ